MPSLSRAASSRVCEVAGSWLLLLVGRGVRRGHGISTSLHGGCGGALGDVGGQQRERVLFGRRLDRPPDRVPAGAARGERRLVAKRALGAL